MDKDLSKLTKKRESALIYDVNTDFKTLSEVEIFKDDLLCFQESVKKCGSIIKSIKPPFVLSVYGDWGSGKTSYMTLLRKYIENQDIAITEWFNAWKYENEDSLILPLLSKLSKNKKIEAKKVDFSTIKKLCVSATTTALNVGANIALRNATLGTVSIEDVKNSLNAYEESSSEVYDKWVNNVDNLEMEFCKLINKISENNKPLVIFIDDLDRCMPEKAIKMLESLKHYFTAEETNCIFIIGVDKKIISKGIEARYGKQIIDGGDYLRKIVDLPIYIDSTVTRNYIENYFKSNNLNELIGTTVVSAYTDIASKILPETNMTIRVINKILDRIVILLMKEKIGNFNPEILIRFLTIKELYPEVYNEHNKKYYFGFIPSNQDYQNDYFIAQKENEVLFSSNDAAYINTIYSMENSLQTKKSYRTTIHNTYLKLANNTSKQDLYQMLLDKEVEIDKSQNPLKATSKEKDYFDLINYATSLID